MAVCRGIIEDIVQGWSRYGFVGAVIGGIIGIIAAAVMKMLPMVLIHLAMIICGKDPLGHPDSPGAFGRNAQNMRGVR